MKNPYWGSDFFDFFGVLFSRLFGGASTGIVSDEIQMLVLIGVALSSSLLGAFLVLKKMTMLANSLSHTLLLGIVLTFIGLSFFGMESTSLTLPILLLASLITGLITTFLTQLLTHVLKLQEDASIGLVFTTLFALGITLVTLFTRNSHIGTEIVMGNVDALHVDDLKLVFSVAAGNLALILLFFKEFRITSFDGALASSLGIRTNLFHYLLMVQVAATAIGAFRAVGVLLVLAFLVGPPLIARLLTDRLRTLLILSSCIGVACSIIGVALSRHFLSVEQMPLSTAGLVVTVIVITYLLTLLLAPKRGLLLLALRRHQLKERIRDKG